MTKIIEIVEIFMNIVKTKSAYYKNVYKIKKVVEIMKILTKPSKNIVKTATELLKSSKTSLKLPKF